MLGIVVGIGEVRKRLGLIEGAALQPGTWTLFLAYVAVPVALFWFLDRTSAISDTSVFAAILVGFGYQGIITGGNQTVQAPGGVSALWTPFVAYADRVAKAALERGARDERRLAERVISEIIKERTRYDALQSLALDRSSDTPAVNAGLTAIDGQDGLGAVDKLEKKTRYLYGIVLSVPDLTYLFYKKKIVGRWFYWMHLKRCAQLIPLLLAALVLLLVLIDSGYTWYKSGGADRAEVTYHSWRLGKTNSTTIDQFRSRRALVSIMKTSDEYLKRGVDELVRLLQRPGLPMERVDLAVQVLLETDSPKTDLPQKLTQALRVGSLDARMRIHDSLVYLAEPCAEKPDQGLTDWKPTEKDSSTMLEQKIMGWNAYWTGCPRS